jgi:hypothetical protein
MHGVGGGPKTEPGRKVISEMRKAEWREVRRLLGLPPDWRSTANKVCKQKRARLALTAAAYVERHGRWQPEGERP